jgi:hypothetical protein
MRMTPTAVAVSVAHKGTGMGAEDGIGRPDAYFNRLETPPEGVRSPEDGVPVLLGTSERGTLSPASL